MVWQSGGIGYGYGNQERTCIFGLCVADSLSVVNTFLKKRELQRITYSPGSCYTQEDYILTHSKDLRSRDQSIGNGKCVPKQIIDWKMQVFINCYQATHFALKIKGMEVMWTWNTEGISNIY